MTGADVLRSATVGTFVTAARNASMLLRSAALTNLDGVAKRRAQLAAADLDHAIAQDERARAQLLDGCRQAYALLAPVDHHWPGRHTIHGQALLAGLREAIAAATGRDANELQDEAQARRVGEVSHG